LIPLKTGTELGEYLGVSKKLISAIALRPRGYYREFEIAKRNGRKRTIQAPRVFLKTIQRYILDCILAPVSLHEAACGFRRGHSCSTGAKQHVQRPFLWNIDLQDFFPSIGRGRVVQAFSALGYLPNAALLLASLCCLDEALPQGAPTSPALANIVFAPIDGQLASLAKNSGSCYTRYADDLSFSRMEPITEKFRQAVVQVIRDAGFRINSRKSRLMGPKCSRQVTGLTVNEKVSIPRQRRRQLRARFHHVRRNPLAFVAMKEQLVGFAAWVAEHHPAEGRRYLEIAHSIPDR
jgi:retron-type reverse transcriptase